MKIGLLDVDGHNFPNLALMKISSYHKQQGNIVEGFFPMNSYDQVYMSKVFTFTPDYNTVIYSDEIIKGGTGYDLNNKLPIDIENIYPDYDLYNIEDISYGYLTRGCPRKCTFCIVGEKEGYYSYQVSDLKMFWNGQSEIKLLDPNILASFNHLQLLKQLVDSKAYIDFTQGLDIRLLTDESINLINLMNIKMIHFAWDNYEFKTYEKLKYFRKYLQFDSRRLRVYVLVNYNTTLDQDLERIYKLVELGYDPYVMVYDKHKLTQSHIIKDLQRWVNNKFIFNVCKRFDDYKKAI